MEEIKINIMYQYASIMKGRCLNLYTEVPKDSMGRDTRWLLTEINFGVRGEKHKPCSFMFEVCKKNTKSDYMNVLKKSEPFNIPYNTNHHTIEYDKHFVLHSGEYIVPTLLEVGQNSESLTIYLKLQEHYDMNGCCADKLPYQKLSKYAPSGIIDNLVVVDDL